VKLVFKQIEPDGTQQSLVTLLESLVLVKSGQYHIESDVPLNLEFFKDSENYRMFFDQFATFASPFWKSDWNFSKFPFRSPSEEIEGLMALLRSGGAYSKARSFSEATEIEREFKHRFKGSSSELVILSAVDYVYSDQETKSYGVSMKGLADLQKISRWFFHVAWDNLIFIINPDTRNLYVIAFTDED